MSTALDRQIRPIYDALDTGSNKSAIVACNKLLKKHPKNELIKALKALALVRSQKVEESLILCDEVLDLKPTNDAVLTAMMHVLRGLGRHKDMVTMFEEAYKQQPSNEELGAQTFFANVRAAQWKSAQQIATRMHKQFQEDRYLYWSVMSAVLQANDVSTPIAMRMLLYKLAHRLLTSSPTPSYLNADRFHLHIFILRELELFDEARKLLDSDVGKTICATNLSCDELRRDIWQRCGMIKEEGERAQMRIVEDQNRNWLEFLSVLNATFCYLDPSQNDSSSTLSEGAKVHCAEHITRTQELFTRLALEDGSKDRSSMLGLLELEGRARKYGLSTSPARLVTLMEHYFEEIGDKACCFEDLKPYLDLEGNECLKWTSFLEATPASFNSPNELRRLINSHKLLRHGLSQSELTVEAESARALLYTKYFMDGLQLGVALPSSELQPADDFALLAGNAWVSLWNSTSDESYLHKAVALLEFALTRSPQSFQARMILIRIYRLLGAPSMALEHYRIMQIKQIQHDTLSHLILSRASTFSLAATGDLTLATECLESTQIYLSNSQETGDFIVRAFTSEKYSQIPEFIEFEDRLDNSLQRDIVKMEHLRMRLAHEPITSDIIDMELIELKFIFDRSHHDNRDFDIITNYQPQGSSSINDQTHLFGKAEGRGWLGAFLKLYIRAFQHGSDLDDTVEEKLLIGDRPKQSADLEKKPLRERLLQRQDEEIAELTADEVPLVDYATALANWLEPYHDYTRPPPSVVLAEAARQTELKTGHPLKGVDLQSLNGIANGNGRKDEDPPVVTEPPELVLKYFEQLKSRLLELRNNPSPVRALHLATLAQEALLLFTVETLRFRSSSVVKINKLGGLVTSFKSIRADAIVVLQEMSTELIKMADVSSTMDSRNMFTDSCNSLTTLGIDQDFLVGVAKKVTEARKKVLEGVGKGLTRVTSL
ncbi:N-acetyltransferase B complex non catalytic subunit-domain-containing protein [Collybia nuda]|uniref:N-acetyltransferase B complex non catalytic subunit-domain-containing protein n=1 Tax=Collybia nuda TaxID=64659 RepID=A0A9P6CJX3_9AGAR|nr:N-acetyltransferase B complex non catalytic subunit-domain-containing protein [Collybia nuda]